VVRFSAREGNMLSSSKCSDRLCGPPTLVFNRQLGPFTGGGGGTVGWARRDDHLPSSSAHMTYTGISVVAAAAASVNDDDFKCFIWGT
jgi:hypothetical protein